MRDAAKYIQSRTHFPQCSLIIYDVYFGANLRARPQISVQTVVNVLVSNICIYLCELYI